MNGVTRRTSSGSPGSTSSDLQIAGVGDVDGDGKADLLWRDTSTGDVVVWLLNGTILVSSKILDQLPSQWEIAQVGDADGDKKADVIWRDTNTGDVVVWLLNGLNVPSKGSHFPTGTDWIIAGRPVPPPLSLTTASPLSAGTVNKSYSITLAQSGGTPAFSWTVFSGSLPPGLTLNPSTGQISGTPTTPGNLLATIRVRDSGNPPQSAQESFSLTITSPPTGGYGGTLTITGAPAIVGGTFVSEYETRAALDVLRWNESNTSHTERLAVMVLTNQIVVAFDLFGSDDNWGCGSLVIGCGGVTVNKSAGTLTFVNVILNHSILSYPQITLNGTLTFTPF